MAERVADYQLIVPKEKLQKVLADEIKAFSDGMKAAMTEITVDGLTGSGMTWTADGEANKAPKAVVIENGAYKAM